MSNEIGYFGQKIFIPLTPYNNDLRMWHMNIFHLIIWRSYTFDKRREVDLYMMGGHHWS
jgi:hypothetical protein